MSRITRRDWGKQAMAGLAMAGVPGSIVMKREQGGAGSAKRYRYLHLDVFTNRPLTGNQLAVFLEPAGLTPDLMQAIAREMAFSEVTFVFPPEDPKTDVRVRIFTPATEMAFAGHPTIGTAFGLAHIGRIKPRQARAVFGLGAGPTPIDLDWQNGRLAFAWMTTPLPTFGKSIDDAAAVASAIGVDAADITSTKLQPQEVSAGGTFLIVPLTTRQAVDRAALDQRAIAAVFEKQGMQRRGVYVFSAEKASDDATTYSRLLSAAREDPATGSAAGPLGCYLVRHGIVSAQQAARIVNAQGVKIQRPSRISLAIDVKNGEIARVRVGGESVVVGDSALAIG
ncbi:MAG: PhzF family phenazine biosynthesis protein [Acidobacteria bacterium]|nr:PhzF family phenazine biosynthesis protein [Acidobacteriota bacterium]